MEHFQESPAHQKEWQEASKWKRRVGKSSWTRVLKLRWNFEAPALPGFHYTFRPHLTGWLIEGASPGTLPEAGISAGTDDRSRENTILNMAHKVNIALNVPYSWWERMLYTNTRGEQRKRHVLQGLFWGIPAALSQEARGRKPFLGQNLKVRNQSGEHADSSVRITCKSVHPPLHMFSPAPGSPRFLSHLIVPWRNCTWHHVDNRSKTHHEPTDFSLAQLLPL